MRTKKNLNPSNDFQDYLNEQLKNPKFKEYYDEFGRQLEVSYQLLQLRKQKGLSQVELAKKLGTTQGNVARLESGKQNFSMQMLEKLAKIYNRNLKIEFVK